METREILSRIPCVADATLFCNAGYAKRMTGRRSEQIDDSGRNLRHISFEFFQDMAEIKLYASVGSSSQIKTISRTISHLPCMIPARDHCAFSLFSPENDT